MGVAKRAWMEAQERGWDSSDEFVCTDCVDDYALEAAIAVSSDAGEACSFCGAQGAAPIDVLTEAFVDGLWREHEDADEGVSYNSAEGGYIFLGDHWDSWDLVEHYGEVFVGDGLIDRVQELIHERVWVERDFAWRRRDDVLRDAWGEFSEAVKFRTRYVIWLVKDAEEYMMRGSGEVPPGRVLYDIGSILDELDLIRELPPTTPLWRAQTHTGPALAGGPSASRLGTAPRAHAKQPNRMSPAGIPMFYAAEESATAIAEVTRHVAASKDHVTVGRFGASAPLMVVDFTSLPSYISLFDPERGHLHRQVRFLNEFVADLSRPIAPGDEQVEYVPTQVMTEFFLRVYEQSAEGRPDISGIRYPSAAAPGGISLVLDVDNAHCVERSADAPTGLHVVLDTGSIETAPI